MELYRFFDSVGDDTREYPASAFAEYFSTMSTSGVWAEEDDALQAINTGANLITTVKSGRAFIDGYFYMNTENLDLTHDMGEAEDRKDLVVLRLDFNTRDIKLAIRKGVAGIDPVAPVIENSELIKEVAIVEVLVPKTSTIIPADNLTDKRTYARYKNKPAWYPQNDIPKEAWQYVIFKNSLSEQEVTDIEANPSLMGIIKDSTASPFGKSYKAIEDMERADPVVLMKDVNDDIVMKKPSDTKIATQLFDLGIDITALTGITGLNNANRLSFNKDKTQAMAVKFVSGNATVYIIDLIEKKLLGTYVANGPGSRYSPSIAFDGYLQKDDNGIDVWCVAINAHTSNQSTYYCAELVFKIGYDKALGQMIAKSVQTCSYTLGNWSRGTYNRAKDMFVSWGSENTSTSKVSLWYYSTVKLNSNDLHSNIVRLQNRIEAPLVSNGTSRYKDRLTYSMSAGDKVGATVSDGGYDSSDTDMYIFTLNDDGTLTFYTTSDMGTDNYFSSGDMPVQTFDGRLCAMFYTYQSNNYLYYAKYFFIKDDGTLYIGRVTLPRYTYLAMVDESYAIYTTYSSSYNVLTKQVPINNTNGGKGTEITLWDYNSQYGGSCPELYNLPSTLTTRAVTGVGNGEFLPYYVNKTSNYIGLGKAYTEKVIGLLTAPTLAGKKGSVELFGGKISVFSNLDIGRDYYLSATGLTTGKTKQFLGTAIDINEIIQANEVI